MPIKSEIRNKISEIIAFCFCFFGVLVVGQVIGLAGCVHAGLFGVIVDLQPL
jgi:hypothetical protein